MLKLILIFTGISLHFSKRIKIIILSEKCVDYTLPSFVTLAYLRNLAVDDFENMQPFSELSLTHAVLLQVLLGKLEAYMTSTHEATWDSLKWHLPCMD